MGLLTDIGGYFAGQDQKHAAKNIISTYNTVGKQSTDQYNFARDQAVSAYNPFLQKGQRQLDQAAWMTEPGYQYSPSDPSYQWRLNQGLDAVQGSAAAQGLLHSGGTMKALNNYAQNAASQQYQQDFNNRNTLAQYGLQGAHGVADAQFSAANGISNALNNMARGVSVGYGAKADALGAQTGALTSGLDSVANMFMGGGMNMGQMATGLGNTLGTYGTGSGVNFGNVSGAFGPNTAYAFGF